MDKSNKFTVAYIISAILLFLSLFAGGIYGIYLSVGLNFMRSTISNVTDIAESGVPNNVSYGANINFQPSMTGIIILSAVLVLISFFMLISMFKQLIFFKQFKLVREAGITQLAERKIKSKSSVVFFAGLIYVISFVAGVVGIFINIRTYVDGNWSWIFYVIDGLVDVLSVVSMVLLIKKIKLLKDNKNKFNDLKFNEESDKDENSQIETLNFDKIKSDELEIDLNNKNEKMNIDNIEYVLLKLKNLKSGKVISNEEYENLRERLTGIRKQDKLKSKSKSPKKKVAK